MTAHRKRAGSALLFVLGALLLSLFTGTPASAQAGWGFIPRVVDQGGTGVAGVSVTVKNGDAVLGQTTTDATGNGKTVAVPGKGVYTLVFDTSATPAGFVGGKVYAVEKEVGAANTLPTQRVLVSLTEHANGGVVGKAAGPADEGPAFSTAIFLQHVVSGLNLGLLLAIATIGLSLIHGTTRLMNFAHGENVTFGALIAFLFCVVFGLPLVIAGLIAVAAGAVFGWLQNAGLWHPLRRKGVGIVPTMIASIGVGLAVRYLYFAIFGSGTRRVTGETIPSVTIGSVVLPVSAYLSMAISLAVLIAIGCWIKYSHLGKATRAVSANSPLASASGIDVEHTIRVVWILAGAMSALSGVLLALLNDVSYDMGFKSLLLMFAAMILGGLGTAFGALVGSLVVGLFTEVLVTWLPPDMKYVGALVVLVLVLLVRPQGIFGRKERIG
ncbi:branched-chain amino acid ABC transporter permease [Amycolatopsis acidicola]|uniref:Branched-chain amino acid ABC transporter permease n=1 Tax=Amycolatopsis acidicola TaxID=2596893 RepID=A0A5N0VLW8_9PSEU|nr:branched-chain amino acid ABC transporter permease [Amycolatopsis acidicola]KAA9165611.1 branched-chain amino acid ABC transporter permease [Amycolatopsis acidicola]